MAGSSIGQLFTVTTWGESHGKAIGAVIDGCPAGISLTVQDIQRDLDRRRPGHSPLVSGRRENDQVQILSGTWEDHTTGTPISLLIPNTDHKPSDYEDISEIFRPGHADYGYQRKYGIRDYRGGGRASGRETAARVGSGAIAKKILSELGITVFAYTESIGAVSIKPAPYQPAQALENPLGMPDHQAAERAEDHLLKIKEQGDSVGGTIRCFAYNIPPGVGEPVFNKLDGEIAKALFSIGGVKAVEIGSGFKSSTMSGFEHNNPAKNYAGGIVGGISDGNPLQMLVHFKPTPSIAKEQQMRTKEGGTQAVSITGRHDPCIVPRAVVVVEAMVAIVLVNMVLLQTVARIDSIKRALVD